MAKITYQELLNFDGYINVHFASSLATLVAQGDIGQNQLTGVSKVYPWEALLFQQFQELLLSLKE
jgi:hypothetical protein